MAKFCGHAAIRAKRGRKPYMDLKRKGFEKWLKKQ
jgi:hypothetical protein